MVYIKIILGLIFLYILYWSLLRFIRVISYRTIFLKRYEKLQDKIIDTNDINKLIEIRDNDVIYLRNTYPDLYSKFCVGYLEHIIKDKIELINEK